jgi:hydrogenase expression/formation protein HypC
MCLAIPGQVTEIHEDNGIMMGKVNFGGITKNVCLAYVPEIAVGDYTIVHVGFALNRIDEESARATLKMFGELGILNEELEVPDEVHE